MMRSMTSKKVQAKRLTSVTASIPALKKVHEKIVQKRARNVYCTNMKQSEMCDCKASSSSAGFLNNH